MRRRLTPHTSLFVFSARSVLLSHFGASFDFVDPVGPSCSRRSLSADRNVSVTQRYRMAAMHAHDESPGPTRPRALFSQHTSRRFCDVPMERV